MSTKNSRLAAAIRYARAGWAVLPVHSLANSTCTCGNSECSRPGKHPRTSHGVKDATADLKAVRNWWKQWPDANVAVATGTRSNIVAIDIDPRNGGWATLKGLEAQHGSLRDTTTAKTGGSGRHFIWAYPDFPVRKGSLGPGIDVLGEGGYIVLPPSSHASGQDYKWRAGHSWKDKPPQPLPASYRRLLQEQSPGAAVKRATLNPPATGGVSEGNRNVTLTSIGGALRRQGLSEAVIRAALLAENDRFQPPLESTEVERIVGSLLRYPVHQNAGADDESFALMGRVLSADFGNGAHLMFVNGSFWRNTGRLWTQTSEEAIQKLVLDAIRAGEGLKGSRPQAASREIVAMLKAQTNREDDPLRLRSPPLPIINCRNGELWIDANGNAALRPHSPTSGLRHCLEVDYDPAATCPQYSNAVLKIFSKSGDAEAMAQFWDEICGYILQPDRSFPLIIVLWGTGSNGKTKLIETLIRLLRIDAVYAGKIERLSQNKFTLGSLAGKLLFVDDDVPAGIKLPDGELKTISEAKLLTGEQKFKPPFNFISRAVPVLLCNNIPSLADLSHGMQRRLVVVPFQKEFLGKEIKLNLFSQIWDREMPGVLNRYLAGYRRLVGRGRLRKPASVIEATQKWLFQANPVPTFIEEACIRGPAARVLLATLYSRFTDWTRAAGITRVQQRLTFRRNLEHLGFEIRHTNRGDAVLGLTLCS